VLSFRPLKVAILVQCFSIDACKLTESCAWAYQVWSCGLKASDRPIDKLYKIAVCNAKC